MRCTVAVLALAVPLSGLAAPVTFVKTYAAVVNNQQQPVTPEDMRATSDGGFVFLTAIGSVNWLLKTDAAGNSQWRKALGCAGTPPGDYTIGLSVQQTADGGYIVAGGAIDCGQPPDCGGLFSTQCGIVEKLDSAGNLIWAKSYLTGGGLGFTSIRQTSDGGYVAAGEAYPSPAGAPLLKLDSSGNVQWQRQIGPAGSITVVFTAVQQTSDGGYLGVGTAYTSSPQCAPLQCENGFLVKLDSGGTLQWQQALRAGGSHSLFLDSVIEASDGSYVAAGAWFGTNLKGGLLVKLDSSGNIVWQNAYSGGYVCLEGGCVELGIVIYSVRQAPDGGYFLAGDGEDILQELGRLVPWMGKVDSSGSLQWEHFYYQVYSPTGRALSEYFAAGDVASDGGYIAAGYTEDYAAGLGLLFVVKTDASGLCGTCADVHPDAGLRAITPGLTVVPLALPVTTPAIPVTDSPASVEPTAIQIQRDC